MSFRAAVLTISDMGARGEREDTSGAAIKELLSSVDVTIDRHEVMRHLLFAGSSSATPNALG